MFQSEQAFVKAMNDDENIPPGGKLVVEQTENGEIIKLVFDKNSKN